MPEVVYCIRVIIIIQFCFFIGCNKRARLISSNKLSSHHAETTERPVTAGSSRARGDRGFPKDSQHLYTRARCSYIGILTSFSLAESSSSAGVLF